MSEPLNPGVEYFQTTDKVLAKALVMAGCKFAPFEAYGPCLNTYSPATARQRGMLPQTPISIQDFERAVTRALANKRPAGIVTYRISRDDPFTSCMKAWDAIPEELEKAKIEKRDPIFVEVRSEHVMVILFLSRLQDREFEPLPWVQSPVLTDGDVHTESVAADLKGLALPEGMAPPQNVTMSGSGMVWNLVTSEATRARLKLPARPK